MKVFRNPGGALYIRTTSMHSTAVLVTHLNYLPYKFEFYKLEFHRFEFYTSWT